MIAGDGGTYEQSNYYLRSVSANTHTQANYNNVRSKFAAHAIKHLTDSVTIAGLGFTSPGDVIESVIFTRHCVIG